jgi:hypothetical protein
LANTPAGSRITGTMLSLIQNYYDAGAVTVSAASLTDLTGVFNVPGGDALPGNVYEVEAAGGCSWGGQSLQFQVAFAGQLMVTHTIGGGVWTNGNNLRWNLLARVTCLTIGATGTFQSMLRGTFSIQTGTNLSATNTIGWTQCDSQTTTYTVDTTAAQGLKIQAAWGSTTNSPTITKVNAWQRKIGVG